MKDIWKILKRVSQVIGVLVAIAPAYYLIFSVSELRKTQEKTHNKVELLDEKQKSINSLLGKHDTKLEDIDKRVEKNEERIYQMAKNRRTSRRNTAKIFEEYKENFNELFVQNE